MESFEKMKRTFWWSTQDQKLIICFKNEKDTPIVTVQDRTTKDRASYSYLLLPTMLENVFSFETPTGRFLVALIEDDRIFLSPQGIYLFPYHKTGQKTQEISINPEGETPASIIVRAVFAGNTKEKE